MAIPRIDVVYRTKSNLEWTELVTCPACGAQWKAGVKVSGAGEGRAAYGFGKESARDSAGIDAFSAAQEEGRSLIARSRCPQCGGRRESGVTASAMAVSFVLGLLVSGVFLFLPEPASGLGCVAWPVASVWLTLRFKRRALAEADARVVVLS